MPQRSLQREQKIVPDFNNHDVNELDRFSSQIKKEGLGVDVTEIYDHYLNRYYETKNQTYLDSGHAIRDFAFKHFLDNIDDLKNGCNIDIEIPFELTDSKRKKIKGKEERGRENKKLCFLKCSHCGDYFVKFSHHALLCKACRVVRKSDTQKERRALIKAQRPIRSCLNCGKMLPGGSSAKRNYCSTRCRVAAFRGNK